MNKKISLVEHGSAAYWQTVSLRDRILRKPLGLKFSEEDLASENGSFHVACYLDEQLVGCLVLKPVDDSVLQMRQVAVAEEVQGKGVGKALVLFSEEFAAKNGFKQMILHARETAIPFYLKLAYQTQGEPYLEVSIPHMTMVKQLT